MHMGIHVPPFSFLLTFSGSTLSLLQFHLTLTSENLKLKLSTMRVSVSGMLLPWYCMHGYEVLAVLNFFAGFC